VANPPDDYALAMAVSGGDRDAFASLYERYFDRLYDFTVRIVGDRDSAADAVQSTFIKAWRHLQERNVPERVKPWLFAIAHNEAIDETRRRKRFARPGASREDDGLDDELGQIEESRSDNPETALGDREIASLVWRAAQGLNRSDYALLDMHVRQELSSEEMATALGIKPGALYTKLSRLRDSLEEAVTAELLSRGAKGSCSVLEGIVAGHGQLDRRLRTAISRHIQGCGACDASRRRLVSPAALFGALAPLVPGAGLRERILERLQASTATGAPVSVAQPSSLTGQLLSLPVLAGAGVLAIVAGVVAAVALVAAGGSDDGGLVTLEPTPEAAATGQAVPPVVLGTDVDSGFVVLNGVYVPPPYRFELDGTDLLLNGTVVLSVSPVAPDSAEPAPSEPATAQDVVDAAASWLIAANLTDADLSGPRRHELLDQLKSYAITEAVIDSGATVLVRDRDGGEAIMLFGTQPLPSSGDQLSGLESQGRFWQDTLEQGGILVLTGGVSLEVPETRAAAFFAALDTVLAGGTREQLEYLAGGPELADALDPLGGIPEAIRGRLPDVLPAPLPTQPSETEPARASAAISGRGGLFLSFGPIGHRLSITPGSMKAHFFFAIELSDASAEPVFAAARRHHYEIVTYRRVDDPGRRNENTTIEQFARVLQGGDAGILYISAHGVPFREGIPGPGGLGLEGYPDHKSAVNRIAALLDGPGYHAQTETAPRHDDEGNFIRTDHLVVFAAESHPDGYLGIAALFRDSLTIVDGR
jgi:RNA polymerase sigma factor (sigma-70 family)